MPTPALFGGKVIGVTRLEAYTHLNILEKDSKTEVDIKILEQRIDNNKAIKIMLEDYIWCGEKFALWTPSKMIGKCNEYVRGRSCEIRLLIVNS